VKPPELVDIAGGGKTWMVVCEHWPVFVRQLVQAIRPIHAEAMFVSTARERGGIHFSMPNPDPNPDGMHVYSRVLDRAWAFLHVHYPGVQSIAIRAPLKVATDAPPLATLAYVNWARVHARGGIEEYARFIGISNAGKPNEAYVFGAATLVDLYDVNVKQDENDPTAFHFTGSLLGAPWGLRRT
jgi:hypothetical protein